MVIPLEHHISLTIVSTHLFAPQGGDPIGAILVESLGKEGKIFDIFFCLSFYDLHSPIVAHPLKEGTIIFSFASQMCYSYL